MTTRTREPHTRSREEEERLIGAEPRLAAWSAFLRAHARVTRQLERELQAEESLALADYDVLVQLALAGDRRLRMSELADRLLLSRSGITRLVDRLERDGLIRRKACDSDARGAYAVLTEAGRRKLDAARRTHLAGVRHHFLDKLDGEEMDRLGDVWVKVLPAG